MNELSNVIKRLQAERNSIVFESGEDEGASEWYAHLSDVIEALSNGTMSIKQASESLGVTL
jgi:hypothetical protein